MNVCIGAWNIFILNVIIGLSYTMALILIFTIGIKLYFTKKMYKNIEKIEEKNIAHNVFINITFIIHIILMILILIHVQLYIFHPLHDYLTEYLIRDLPHHNITIVAAYYIFGIIHGLILAGLVIVPIYCLNTICGIFEKHDCSS